MQTIFVVGAGFMGAGIAQVCIQRGYRVVLSDKEADALERAAATIKWSLDKLQHKGLIQEPATSLLGRLETCHGFPKGENIAWTIEAVYEKESLKKSILAQLEEALGDGVMLATNTSSIPISRMAAALQRPERLVGLHFFGPVPLMGLVEVVRGVQTSDEVFEAGLHLVKSLGKHPVCVNKDIPGFVMNRVFAAAFRECQELVSQGVASPEDIDAGMRLGYGWHRGPFEIADNAGLDTVYQVAQSMQALGEVHLFSDSQLLAEMVAEGKLGRKSGQGFYRYDRKEKHKGDMP